MNRVLSISLFLAIVFTGCSQCQDCELGGATETICETEFDSPNQYQDAIADREAQGAVCTSSGGF